jgi:hypothetical protein
MEAHKNETPRPAIARLSSKQTNEEAKTISQKRQSVNGLSTPAELQPLARVLHRDHRSQAFVALRGAP